MPMPYNSPEQEEESRNPLRIYRHLIPTTSASYFTQPLTFHLFATNVSILYPNEQADNLRLVVARTSDQAVNHATGEMEDRHLFYAALMALGRVFPDVETMSPTVLIKGPAVPYFSPIYVDPAVFAEKNKASSFSLSSSSRPARNPNEDSDLKEVKEKAIILLMAKLDREVHKMVEVLDGEMVEIWEAKGWKFVTPAPPAVKEGAESSSVKSATLGRSHGKRESTWFSKS